MDESILIKIYINYWTIPVEQHMHVLPDDVIIIKYNRTSKQLIISIWNTNNSNTKR